MSFTPELKLFNTLLEDFGVSRLNGHSTVAFTGLIPNVKLTNSQKINLSLVGSLPAAGCALVAAQIYEARGGKPQDISVDLSRGHNYIDPDFGMTPAINGQEIPFDVVIGNPFLRNFFETQDGRFVVLSAVYVDLVYRWLTFLGCSPEESDVRTAIKKWNSTNLIDIAARAGLPAALVHSEEEWISSSHGSFLSTQPIVPVKKIGNSAPKQWPSTNLLSRPLQGIKVLCATHAIAGPSAGRTLAEHGASVLQVMFTHGFEHNFVYNSANLGCASTRLNFHKAADIDRMWELIGEADVWIDSYRDGALAKFGFDDCALVKANPTLIISHVRCFGHEGPWASRPGFDMQGSAASGMMSYCGDGPLKPAWPQGSVINDYTTGFYGALAIENTLLRRSKEGGAYILSPSLVGTAMSLLKYFKSDGHNWDGEPNPPFQIESQTPMGYLRTWAPLPQMSITQARYDPILLVPMGSCAAVFPGTGDTYDVKTARPKSKAEMLMDVGLPMLRRLAALKELREEALGAASNSHL